MRMMLKMTIPMDKGNQRIKDGTILKVMESIMADLKPEAVYLTTMDGQRGGYIVLDMKDSSELPKTAEPLFLALNATVEYTPVMNLDDLRRGAPGLEAAVKKYG